MKVINYFECDNKEYWLEQIGGSDWGAGKFLYSLLKDGRLWEFVGDNAKVLLLVEGDELISFCTYAQKDDIRDTDLKPWIGFVYTFPQRRGQHCVGKLFDAIADIARAENVRQAYISTDHTGLYEKYGCEFYRMMPDIEGKMSRVYVKRFE